jgi:DNA-binding transcriptional MerR regulator
VRAPQPAQAGDQQGQAPQDQPERQGPAQAEPGDRLEGRLDDEDYPAYSMGRAAEMLEVTPAFLRSLDTARLIVPQRSPGGHRRYSRYQLRLAQRARDLVGQGTPLEAACRIIILEDQLAEAQRINAELRRHRPSPHRNRPDEA